MLQLVSELKNTGFGRRYHILAKCMADTACRRGYILGEILKKFPRLLGKCVIPQPKKAADTCLVKGDQLISTACALRPRRARRGSLKRRALAARTPLGYYILKQVINRWVNQINQEFHGHVHRLWSVLCFLRNNEEASTGGSRPRKKNWFLGSPFTQGVQIRFRQRTGGEPDFLVPPCT